MTQEARAPLHERGAVALGDRPSLDRTGVPGVPRGRLDEQGPRDAGQLLNTLAHDVRQPLTSIRMNIQTALRLLRDKRPNLETAISALEDALVSEGAAADVVRAASERLALAQWVERRSELNATLLDVQRQLRVATSSWGDRLDLDLAADEPIVKADPLRLRGVILSLVLAALDAVDADESNAPGRIALGTRLTRDGFAELSLRGLPPRTLPADRDVWTRALGAAAAHAWECHTVVESLASGVTVRVFLPVGSTSTHDASDEVDHGDAPPSRRR